MIPSRLIAPAPGWQRETDVVVVGSGVAGVTAPSPCLLGSTYSPLRPADCASASQASAAFLVPNPRLLTSLSVPSGILMISES